MSTQDKHCSFAFHDSLTAYTVRVRERHRDLLRASGTNCTNVHHLNLHIINNGNTSSEAITTNFESFPCLLQACSSPSWGGGRAWVERDCQLCKHLSRRLQRTGRCWSPQPCTDFLACKANNDTLLETRRAQNTNKRLQPSGAEGGLTFVCRGLRCSLWTSLVPGTRSPLCSLWRCCHSAPGPRLHRQ